MAIQVINLASAEVSLGDENGWYLESPGFALLKGSEIVCGSEAELQSRLYPTACFDSFWQGLNLDPLLDSRQRHFVDLAYAHLLFLSEKINLKGKSDFIVVVPSHYDNEQLGLLLGMAKHTPFRIIGLIDAAILSGITVLPTTKFCISADFQPRQLVTTQLHYDQGVSKGAVSQIAGVGIQDVFNKLIDLFTDVFVSQCRFNPQHKAESEQQLYNMIPEWIKRLTSQSTITLTLNDSLSNHKAELSRESLVDALDYYYQKILTHFIALRNAEKNDARIVVLVDEWIADLPGLNEVFDSFFEVKKITRDSKLKAIFQNQAEIKQFDSGARLTNSLSKITDIVTNNAENESFNLANSPTHLLIEDHAFPIEDLIITNSRLNPGILGCTMASSASFNTLGRLVSVSGKVYAEEFIPELFVNGVAQGFEPLAIGDVLSTAESTARLIRVQNG